MRSVYEFTEPRDYLAHIFKEKQATNPRFSLRSWARILGFKSPAALSMILRGQRRLQIETTYKLAEGLKLKQEEQYYLQLLTLFTNSKTQGERDVYSHLLGKLRPQGQLHSLPLDQFRLISDWYHYAIYGMTDLKGFEPSGAWISQRLGKTITELTAQEALDRLVRVGLLSRTAGGVSKTTQDTVRTSDDVPNAALRKLQTQMLTQAQTALESQSVLEREISSMTFCVEAQSIAEAKERIREFQREMSERYGARVGSGDHVYHLGVQFFRLTHNQESV